MYEEIEKGNINIDILNYFEEQNIIDHGIAKGAFSETEAEARFNKWMTEKAGKIEAKGNKLEATTFAKSNSIFR